MTTVKRLLRTAWQQVLRPRFSVLITLEGTELAGAVERSIRSALNQGIRSLEVVVVHREGAAEVNERLEFLRRRDLRIRLVVHAEHGEFRRAASRVEALKVATGRYQFFLEPPAKLAGGVLERIWERIESDRPDLLIVSPESNAATRPFRIDENPDFINEVSLPQILWKKREWTPKLLTLRDAYWEAERCLELVLAAERIIRVQDRLTDRSDSPPSSPRLALEHGADDILELSFSIAHRMSMLASSSSAIQKSAQRGMLKHDLSPWIAQYGECSEAVAHSVRTLVRALSETFAELDWLGIPFWDRLLAWCIAQDRSSDAREVIISRRLDSGSVPLRRQPQGGFEIASPVLARISPPVWAKQLSPVDLSLHVELWDVEQVKDSWRITLSTRVPGIAPSDLPDPIVRVPGEGRAGEALSWVRTRTVGVDMQAGDPWRTYEEGGVLLEGSDPVPERLMVLVSVNGTELSREIVIPRSGRTHAEPSVDAFSLADDVALFEGDAGEQGSFDLWLASSSVSHRLPVELVGRRWLARFDLSTSLPRGGYFLRWSLSGGDMPTGWCRSAAGFAHHPVRCVGNRLAVEVARRQGDQIGVVLSAPVSSREWSRYGQHQLASNPSPPVTRGVFFDSFWGKNTGDSPGELCRALHEAGCDVPLWFSVGDGRVAVPDGAIPIVVGTAQWYEVMRGARVIVSNNHLPPWFAKQPGQYWIQTWHGTPIKRLLRDAPRQFIPLNYRRLMERQVPQWDLLLAQSEQAAHDMRSSTGYGGEIRVGELPRNARMGRARPEEIRKGLCIAPDAFVVLYAPTWRDSDQSGSTSADSLVDPGELARRANVTVMVRSHHMSVASMSFDGAIDVSGYPHVEDLMSTADILITDYSSIVYDFELTGRPIILHVPDLEWYRDVERGFYREWPPNDRYPISTNLGELVAEVQRARSRGRIALDFDCSVIEENTSWLVERIIRRLND